MKVLEYCALRMFAANTFFIVFDDNDAICIDPGDNSGDIERFIDKNNLNIIAVLLTHGHFDHIRDLNNINKKFKGIPIYIHEGDYECLSDDLLNGSASFKSKQFEHLIPNEANIVEISRDEILNIHDLQIKCIYTPFHTKGSLCFYINEFKMLFSGDTLFKGSVGRTDLKGSCPHLMQESLSKLKILPENTIVYPGHDENTTIKYEKEHNFYLK